MKPFIYMGYGVNKLIFGITGTEEPCWVSLRSTQATKIKLIFSFIRGAVEPIFLVNPH
ncbi:hypothetical protein NIES806_24790 [Dolichospermum compactum NIES-806]|uniref:Uncharacterized protein n=1 Tax=Dolichospermum compactum NIES-806 TaxID=1973481 RepID=A0A1Z4V465_9CYAN|nr:hypothetical protein NIES806_24790 [Dolichospermum compactum NIES-806]